MTRRQFTRVRSTKRREIRVDAVYDIECENWTKFVLGGLLLADGRYQEFEAADEDAMIAAILNVRGHVWAHFGGKYDHQWTVARSLELYPVFRAEMLPVHSRLIWARLPLGTELYDSFALAPMSLKRFTSGQGVSKQELSLPCRCCQHCDGQCHCKRNCGGYCSIRRNMPIQEKRQLREYLRADCRSLMDALNSLQDFAADHDLDLGKTVGGSAWTNARRMLGLEASPYIDDDARVYKYARSGYYGGACQVTRRNVVPIAREFDVNAMYPSMLLRKEVPLGIPRMHYDQTAVRAFKADRPGIYRCDVFVPDNLYLPPLAVRLGTGKGHVYFPTGHFCGTWTLPELQYAMSLGCTVKPDSGLVFPKSEIVFAPWIQKIWDLRKTAPGGKKSPLGEWLKFYGNSLTGKFGARPEKEKWIVDMPSEDMVYCRCLCLNADCMKPPLECQCKRPKIPEVCYCRPTTQVSDRIWSEQLYSLDSCSHVHWSAYLTAGARIELRQFQYSDGIGGRSTIYCDTDSTVTDMPRNYRVGNEIGEWEDKGDVLDFYAIAPKVYYYSKANHEKWDSEKGHCKTCMSGDIDGRCLNSRAKGLKIESGEAPTVGQVYKRESVTGFRSGLTHGLFTNMTVERTLNIRYGDRVPLHGSDEGYTRAMTIDEAILAVDDKLDLTRVNLGA